VNLSLTSLGTKDAKEYVTEHKGRQVRLIDTPGFDDDEMSDADLLKIIGDFLGTLVINGATLAGMILLQPVTTNRVPGSEERRTRTNGG
jgi:predicted GTPase